MTISHPELPLQANRHLAICHLKALGYGESTPIYLRCFPEGKGSARNFQGTLADFPWVELERLQRQGYGVYFVANGQGHRDADVQDGRLIFFEHDDLDKSLQQDVWKGLGLPAPTVQIDTGGKSIHSYWRLDPGCPIGKWRELQADLLDFADADRSIKNPSRVMRLAGFMHQGTGQIATIVSHSDQGYSYAQLRGAVPRREQPLASVPLEVCLTQDDRALIQHGAPQGQRNTCGAKLARNLIGTEDYLRQQGQRYEDSARQLFEGYCSRCQPPLPPKEADQIWHSAAGDQPTPSLTTAAIANCIKAWNQRSDKSQSALAKQTPTAASPPSSGSRLVRDFHFVEAKLGERLRLNTLKNRIELDGQPFDLSKAQLILALEHHLDLGGGREQIEDIVTLLAERSPYSPVVDYLESVHAIYGKDTSILTGLAARYFGESEPMADTFIKRWLVAAVARAFSPGCQADYILVLQGKQGFGKSGFFHTLANGWFDDGIAATGSDKDQLMKLHSAWIVELSELEAIFRKKDVSAFKAFITARTDALRKPYGRVIEELPRANVFGASTNEDGFLNDPTGNRRFWVVKVNKSINIAQLAQERDQIWAAAVALYKAHEQWHPTPLEAIAAEAIAQDYQQADPWLEAIHDFVRGRDTVLTSTILTIALQVEVGRQSRADEMRVASCLRELGFQAARKLINGRRTRVWIQPPDNLDNHGQPQLSRLSIPETQTQIEVDNDGDNLDNLSLLHSSGSGASAVYAPDIQVNFIEKVVQVGQVGQSPDEQGFQAGQPAELGLSQLSKGDATELAVWQAALQVGERVTVWHQDQWQSAMVIALPNHHPLPTQRIQAWRIKLDAGAERYIWAADQLHPINDIKDTCRGES
jgi:predicted P-loop ATPase